MLELESQPGRFGAIRVLERRTDGARLYCIGDSIQTMIGPDGSSLFGHVHAIKRLLGSAMDVLLIGGAGGSLATMLARRGRNVTVVDIDPAAEKIARRHFDLDARVVWVTADALAFVRDRVSQYDAVVMDACDSYGTRSKLAEPPSLLPMINSLRPGGPLLINLAGANEAPPCGWDLAGAMAAIGFNATLFHPEHGEEENEILHISTEMAAGHIDLAGIDESPAKVRAYLTALRRYVATPNVGARSSSHRK